MTYDLTNSYSQKDYAPIKISYEGYGRAYFNSPSGLLSGPVSIEFDEFGTSSIIMRVEKVTVASNRSAGSFFINTMMLLNSSPLPPPGGSIEIPLVMISNNLCTNLIVDTTDGCFVATRNIYYSLNFGMNPKRGDYIDLDFHVWHSYFLVKGMAASKYWRMPLTNFVSKYGKSAHDIKRNKAYIPDKSGFPQRLITFEYDGGIGFIEPLGSVEERTKRLQAGQEQRSITALMVGEVGKTTEAAFINEDWLPFRLLPLLGFTTGTEVGTTWLELLDKNGKLAVRIHVSTEPPIYSKGHIAIDEFLHNGTGELITKYYASFLKPLPNLRVVMKSVVRGGLEITNLEDSLDHFFRALDGLCKYYGFASQNLMNSLHSSQQQSVKDILRDASSKITGLIQQAETIGQLSESAALKRIRGKISNASNVDKDFGLAVVELLQYFGFSDIDVVNNYYLTHPRSDNLSWSNVLSLYRGVTVHESYFDFEQGGYDIDDVTRFVRHLKDILIRIVLKLLDYQGTYKPAVPNPYTIQQVDWIKPSTDPKHLGYEV